MSEERLHAVVIPLPSGTARADLRRLCARLHDVAGVVAVEVGDGQRSVRVVGRMGIDELRAAVDGSCEGA